MWGSKVILVNEFVLIYTALHIVFPGLLIKVDENENMLVY